MKTSSPLEQTVQFTKPAATVGFTIIELLVVISIIAVLAGLVLAGSSYANKKARAERARGEIQAISLALEAYKIDNGDYPRDTATDAVNAKSGTGNTKAAALQLYMALSGDLDKDGKAGGSGDKDSSGELSKVYFEFKPNMLYPKPTPGGPPVTIQYLADPYGAAYGYSTIGSSSANTGGNLGYNPTFDLWSTNDKPGDSQSWIKNW